MKLGADELTGRSCSECGIPLRSGPLGGPNDDTDYDCDGSPECSAHTCFHCIQVHLKNTHGCTCGDWFDPECPWHTS